MRLLRWMLVCCTLCAQTKSLSKDRADDSYAIYTAVLADPKLSHSNDNRKYLIEDATGLGVDDPRGCIQAPAQYRVKFEEMLGEYSRDHADRFQLERKFTVDRPYELLTEAEGKRFTDFRMMPHIGEEEPEKFRGAIDLLTLGNVYFDHQRSMAMVRTGAWCGGLCGLWAWRVLAKEGDGKWHERDWPACVSIAQNLNSQSVIFRRDR